MLLLALTSLLWAFSFGLIGSQLAGLPPAWLACIRLAISALVFLPFVRRAPPAAAARLFLVGAVQFGLMYLAYMASFQYLPSHEVALYTVVTPLFIAALSDLAARRLTPWNLLAALLAVAGAAVIQWHGMKSTVPLRGFLLVQLSNLCFAAGQLAYRAAMAKLPPALSDLRIFFWLYLGGFACLAPLALRAALAAGMPTPTPHQWATLLYLGAIPSGIGFFLWNRGARSVSTGQLAVMNNLKIPLGVLVSLLLFRESANLHTLLAGSLLLAVAFFPLHRKKNKPDPADA